MFMAKALILKQLLDLKRYSVNSFEQAIGVGTGTVRKAIERNAEISIALSEKIRNKFPDVRKEWLLTGEGEMLTTKEIIPLGKPAPGKAAEGWEGVPMYNVPVTASFVQSYRDELEYTPKFHLRDPQFRDCDFGAVVTGDSMHAEIRHGDYVVCKQVQDYRFIVFGDIYYVVATNGLETCKYVNAHPKHEDYLLLVPRNENISPSPIPKDMILKMYKVKGILRGY
ncbi:MAG: hypothetical protein EBX40_00460 [Gammaproteobacteria bacterium]|nr:hypothetical protein [Gammaproteobacteria bacterium]